MYGDTTVIRHLAQQLRDQADDIRAQAVALLADAAQTPWQGRAADAMRESAAHHAADMTRTARLHDDAAAALVEHARRVDQMKALIASIEQRVHGLVDAARDRLADLAGEVAQAAGDVADAVGLGGGKADPVDRLLDRFVPPPPGSREWLDVDLPGLPDLRR